MHKLLPQSRGECTDTGGSALVPAQQTIHSYHFNATLIPLQQCHKWASGAVGDLAAEPRKSCRRRQFQGVEYSFNSICFYYIYFPPVRLVEIDTILRIRRSRVKMEVLKGPERLPVICYMAPNQQSCATLWWRPQNHIGGKPPTASMLLVLAPEMA